MVAAVRPAEIDEETTRKMAEDRKQAILLRARTCIENMPTITGHEDDDTRNLKLANRFLRQAKIPTLKPLLPLLLKLKGRPYTLKNYFPFEPFFRTRMARTTLLKTGRQVSKCFDEDTEVLLADGRKVLARHLKVGDVVMSRGADGVLRPRKIVNVWRTGLKASVRITTFSGKWVRVSRDHRMLVRDADNHTEDFRVAAGIYRGDYVCVVDALNRQTWERVAGVMDDLTVPMIDVEIEEDHTFVLGDMISHNSTSLAAQGVVFSNSLPYFSTLFVTPLFEMVRRFSHQYVREFIENSPAKRLFVGKNTVNSVLQKSFRNGSTMYFSYAFLDAERTRGIPADCVTLDEIQDLQFEFIQIIEETLSGSPYAIKRRAGTPKSLDNTMEACWQDSSQAEWAIKCRTGGCNHWNIPSMYWDLLDMIGPYHRNISEKCPGVVCSKCRKPLDPRTGRWIHAYPERRWQYAGYHVPQQIMPMHYADPEKWDFLVGKMTGRGGVTMTTFLNEVCGESCDTGSKILTVTDLKAAAVLPWKNRWEDAVKRTAKGYTHKILAVDWGGGGGRVAGASASKKAQDKRLRTSYTSLAVLGRRPDGKIDVIWGYRSVKTHDYEWEARLVLDAMVKFRCTHLVHDYGGAGAGREVLIAQAGFPTSHIIPVKYHGSATENIMSFVPATEDHPRDWYSVDKSRSLVTTCMCIRHGLVRFFEYDYKNAHEAGLMHDFLALIEEKVTMRLGTDAFYISSNPNASDDFAQAVNIGCCTLWHMTKSWPDIAEAAHFKLPAWALRHIHPTKQVDWEDIS